MNDTFKAIEAALTDCEAIAKFQACPRDDELARIAAARAALVRVERDLRHYANGTLGVLQPAAEIRRNTIEGFLRYLYHRPECRAIYTHIKGNVYCTCGLSALFHAYQMEETDE